MMVMMVMMVMVMMVMVMVVRRREQVGHRTGRSRIAGGNLVMLPADAIALLVVVARAAFVSAAGVRPLRSMGRHAVKRLVRKCWSRGSMGVRVTALSVSRSPMLRYVGVCW